MTSSNSIETELLALKAAIKPAPSNPPPTKTADEAAPRSEAPIPQVESLVRELQNLLATLGTEIDETLTAHPIVSVSAAFVLGIAVGQLMKRRQV